LDSRVFGRDISALNETAGRKSDRKGGRQKGMNGGEPHIGHRKEEGGKQKEG
jgi:hypothetical protein